VGVQDVTVELECATFVAELEPNAKVDVDALRNVIESWEGYDYRVGKIEVGD
jgi:hypothetical protein